MSEDNKDLDKRFDALEKKLDSLAVANPFSGFQNQNVNSDEIDLRELWNVIWAGKWIIVGVTFLFAVASVVYALSLPNMYKSEALLAPAEENSGGGLAGMAGQLGGLASLAGVNLGGGGADKTTLALEVLKSREFISYFIEKHELLVPLMAVNGWDGEKGELIIDLEKYDPKSDAWVRNISPPKKSKPSMQEAYEEFFKIFNVSQDKKTNFVFISIEFYSPTVSKQWVDWLVEDINFRLKARDVAEAERSIKYLNSQLEKTSIADMQSIFYELIEEQTKTVMFAEVRDEYVFKIIDPPVVPEKRSKPSRALIVIFCTFLGGIASIIFSVLKSLFVPVFFRLDKS
ncbi:MAG: hypothetical protein ACI86C_001502 [Candidatus Latescibacterota bacterium]|jgi:uncharacterized protein involved in exopolysaccharide biosynthesis